MRRQVPLTTTSCRPTREPSLPAQRGDRAHAMSPIVSEPKQRELAPADALVRRFTTGRWPLWRVLARRGHANGLFVALEWVRARSCAPYSVVEVSADAQTLSWRDFPSARHARAALTLTA